MVCKTSLSALKVQSGRQSRRQSRRQSSRQHSRQQTLCTVTGNE